MSFIKTEIDETAAELVARTNAAHKITEAEFSFIVGKEVWCRYKAECGCGSNPITGFYSSGTVAYVSMGNIDRIFSRFDYKAAIVTALRAGKKVTMANGDIVFGEGIEYDWQEAVVWVKHSNGSARQASYSDITSAIIK